MTTPTPPDFIDRVMRTVEHHPTPSAPRSFAHALREGSREDAVATLAVAWRLAARAKAVPNLVRVQALALVVAVAFATGAAVTVAAAAAVNVAAPIIDAARSDGIDERTVTPAATPAPPDPRTTPVTAASDPADRLDDVPASYDDEGRAPMPPVEAVPSTLGGDDGSVGSGAADADDDGDEAAPGGTAADEDADEADHDDDAADRDDDPAPADESDEADDADDLDEDAGPGDVDDDGPTDEPDGDD